MNALKETLTTALTHHKAGRAQQAEGLYKKILVEAPDQPDALHLLGLLYHQRGDHDAALALITRAIGIHAREAAYFSNRGEIYRARSRFAEAAADFQRAIALAPGSAAAHNNLGLTLQSLKQLPEARASLERALAIKPDFPEALNNMGLVLQDAGDREGAIGFFRRAVGLRPAYWGAQNNLAVALIAEGRAAEAKVAFQAGLASAPEECRAYFMTHIGKLLFDEGDHQGAVAILQDSIALDPNDPIALNNLGSSQQRLGNIEAAMANQRRALALDADYADAHRNLGTVLLMLGRYAEAWPEYAWRWKCADFEDLRRSFTQPAWDGNDHLSGPLLVWGEQGLGDEVFYASILSDLLRSGVPFIWEADPRIVSLLQRSFPGAAIVPRSTPPHSETAEAVAQIPAANLGQFFRDDLSKFPPNRRSYLVADAGIARRLRSQIPVKPGDRIVGVSWVSHNRSVGTAKTAPLMTWAPVLRAPNICFVDLQYGETTDERARVTSELGVQIHHLDGLDLGLDLEGLAALISVCDLVISVSNTTVHVAGALGVPVWVLVPAHVARFWYWGHEGESTPWYPSATLIRHTIDGNWDVAMKRVAARLHDHL